METKEEFIERLSKEIYGASIAYNCKTCELIKRIEKDLEKYRVKISY